MDYKLAKNKKEFVQLLSQLEVEEFFGICKIMNIPLLDKETNELREGEILITEVLEKFPTYNRTQRRNLLRLMRAAHKAQPKVVSTTEVEGDESEH